MKNTKDEIKLKAPAVKPGGKRNDAAKESGLGDAGNVDCREAGRSGDIMSSLGGKRSKEQSDPKKVDVQKTAEGKGKRGN